MLRWMRLRCFEAEAKVLDDGLVDTTASLIVSTG